MIAEIIEAEVKASRIDGSQFVAMKAICEENIQFLYISPKAIHMFEVLIAFADIKKQSFGKIDSDAFIGKLIPVEPYEFDYCGRSINTIRFNSYGMEECLKSYISSIEEINEINH